MTLETIKVLSILIISMLTTATIYQGYKIRTLEGKLRNKSETIVAIDADKLLREFTINLAKQSISKEEIKQKTQASLQKMNKAIDAFKNQGLIVLDKRCVISGSVDITGDIRKVMQEGKDAKS